MAGFGHSKFGNSLFGKSDIGTDLIVNSFPTEALEDATPQGADPMDDSQNLLLQMLKTYARMVNVARDNVDSMVELVDYETAPANILIKLGETFGLDIDQNDPDFLKRSFVAHASQWLQIKSSVEGYSVRGLASGFLVTVNNFWRVDPAYTHYFPLRHRYYLTPAEADPGVQPYFHVDVPPGTYMGPPSEEGPDYAKSAWLHIVFEVKDYALLPNNFNALLDLAIDKISDVQAIQHELTPPEFRVTLNANETITPSIMIIEQIVDYPMNEFDHYDIIPADIVMADNTSEISVA